MANIPCFVLHETQTVHQLLRRYTVSHWDAARQVVVPIEKCPLAPGEFSYHNALVPIEDAPRVPSDLDGAIMKNGANGEVEKYKGDPRWPTHCGCGYEFLETDNWQVFTDLYYEDDSGNRYPQREIPAGGMWVSPYLERFYRPQLEHCFQVMLPDGTTWCPDSRANNCTMPDDHEHHCWILEGGPLPHVSVGKGGKTCGAGAGSILSPGWHGFLVNGELVSV